MNDSESIDERELFNRVYDPRTFRIKNLLKDQKGGEQQAISFLTNNDETESAISPSKYNQTSQMGSDMKNSEAGYTSDGSPFKQTGGLYSSCFDESEAKKYTLQQSHNSLLESKMSSSTTRSPLMNTQKLAFNRVSNDATPEPKDQQQHSKVPPIKGQFDSFGTPHTEPIRELSHELESNAGERSADRLQRIANEKLESVRRLSEDIMGCNVAAEDDFQQNSQSSLSSRLRKQQQRLSDTQTGAQSGTRNLSLDIPADSGLLRESVRKTDSSNYNSRPREETLKNSSLRIKNDIDLPQHSSYLLDTKKSKQSDYHSIKTGSATSQLSVKEEEPPKPDSKRFIFSDRRLPEVSVPENKPLLNTSFTLGKKPKLGLSQAGEIDFNQYSSKHFEEAAEDHNKYKNDTPDASAILHQEVSVIQSQKTTPGKVQNSMYWDENLEQNNFSRSMNNLDQEQQIAYLEKKCRELTTALQRQTNKVNIMEKERCTTVQELQEEVSRLQNQLFQKNVESQKQINLLKNHQKKVLNDQPGLYKEMVHKDQIIQEQEKQIHELRSQMSELTKLSTMHTTERDISRLSSFPRHSKIYVEDEMLPDESNKENVSLHSNRGGSTAASSQVRLRDYENQIQKLKKEIEYLKNEAHAKPNVKIQLAAQEVIQALCQPEALNMLRIWGAMTELKCEIRARDTKGILGKSEQLLDAVEQASIDDDDQNTPNAETVPSSLIFESVIQLAMDLSQKLGTKATNVSMLKGDKLWIDIETLYYKTESELYNALKAKFPVEPASVLAGKENTLNANALQDRTNNQSVCLNQSSISEKQSSATSVRATEKINTQNEAPLQDKELIFSDFSDDDFANEDQEEKLAITALANIKAGIRESRLNNPEINPIKQLLKQNPDLHLPPQKDHVFVDQLHQILEAEDIRTPVKEFVALILRLDPSIKGVVNLVQFLENIRSKNQLWWKNKIHNAHFDLKYKHTNLTPLFARDSRVREFVFKAINEKIQQFKMQKGLTEHENLTAFMAGFSSESFTKAGLRAFFRRHKFLFTRLETHVIQYLLEQTSSQSKGGVSMVDLKELLINGDIFRVYAKMRNEGSTRTLRPRQKSDATQPLKVIAKLRAELQSENARYSPMKIKDAFKLADKRFTGLLNYQQFRDVCDEYELPFQDQRELADVFEYLAKDYAGRCPMTLARIENNIYEEGRVQYAKFVELLTEDHAEVALDNEENSNVEAKLKFTEAKLKLAEQKILELESQAENSATVNRSTVNIAKPKDQFSNERTLRMKVEDLEFENARLRQTLATNEKKEKNTTTIKPHTETEVARGNSEQMIQLGNRKYRIEELVQKFEAQETSLIAREMEFQNELKLLKKSMSDEVALIKRQFEHERAEMAKIIEGKNNEIRDYRNELEAILVEMEELRRQTYRPVV